MFNYKNYHQINFLSVTIHLNEYHFFLLVKESIEVLLKNF